MKTLPALLNPIELAEMRICSQSDIIARSIIALELLCYNFKTHDGGGLFKSYHRKRALASLEALNDVRALAKEYGEYRCRRLIDFKVGKEENTGELAKLGFLYVGKLADVRDHVINAFAYDEETNRYDYRVGKRNWEWMTTDLKVPVLKSYK